MLYNRQWGKSSQNQVQVILHRAANLVRKRGLAKGMQLDYNGSVCVHGAISIAATGKPYKDRSPAICNAERYVYNYLKSIGVDERIISPNGLAGWNNCDSRTAEEVIEALEGAAALACCEA